MKLNRLPENLEAWLGISLAVHTLLAVLLISWWGGADQVGSDEALIVTLSSISATHHPPSSGETATRHRHSPSTPTNTPSFTRPQPVVVQPNEWSSVLPEKTNSSVLPPTNTDSPPLPDTSTSASDQTSASPGMDSETVEARSYSHGSETGVQAASFSVTGGTYAPPSLLQRKEPVYPAAARANGWEGTVKLAVTVGIDGRPDRILVAESSSYADLDRSALQAARSWRFAPASRGGLPQEETVHIPVEFKLLQGKP